MSLEDLESCRERQCAVLAESGISSMVLFQLKAFWSGFPPDESSILAPRKLADQCASGLVTKGETPVGLVGKKLEELCGSKSNNLDLGNAFANSSRPPTLEPSSESFPYLNLDRNLA